MTLIGSNSHAQFTHEGEYEMTLLVPYIDDVDVSFEGGASALVNSDIGFGFGFLTISPTASLESRRPRGITETIAPSEC